MSQSLGTTSLGPIGKAAGNALATAWRLAGRSISTELFLLILSFFVLAFLMLASLWVNNRSQVERENYTAVVNFSADMNLLNARLRAIESSQRGYFLTDDVNFLATYETNVGKIGPLLQSLAGRAGSFGHTAEFSNLGLLVNEKVAEMAQTVSLYKAGQKTEAINLVKAGLGLELMNDVRDIINRISVTSYDTIANKKQEVDGYSYAIQYIIFFGTTIIIALASAALYYVSRVNYQLSAAQEKLRSQNDDLEETIEERMRELRSANEEIQRFAYIVSHDLRSPLVNIMGFTTELESLRAPLLDGRDRELERDFDESIGFIKSSIAKMERLIAAILRISREGGRPLAAEPLDLEAMLSAIVASMQHQVTAADATVRIGRLPGVTSDRLAVEQILSNLVDNAVKYLRDGIPGEITITGDVVRGRAVIRISDNGRGVEERDKTRIFELFRRAGRQDKAGEGMGLAHTLALVRRLGGTITLASEVNAGSTFTLTLPLVLTIRQSKERSA